MFVVTDLFSSDVLALLADTAQPLDGVQVGLFQNNYTPTRSSAIGDLVDADFTGYALSAAVVWSGPFMDPVLGPYLVGDLKTFSVGSSPTTTNDIYGYYVIDSGGNLIAAERFASPVPMAVAGATIPVVPTFGEVSQAA